MVSNVLLMVVRLDIRTEPIHENNVTSRYRGRHSSRVKDFGQLDLMKPVPTWRIDTKTVGFEVQEHPRSADTASWSLHDGDRAKEQGRDS